LVITVTATPCRQAAGLAQVTAAESDQLVAVDDVPFAVHGEHAVAVAVEGEAREVVAGLHSRAQAIHVGGAAVVVDVCGRRAVARTPMSRRAFGDLGGGPERRAVGAVEQDLLAAQIEVLEAFLERAQVISSAP